MRQINKEIFLKLIKQILMSVYWAMYYFEELELLKKQNKKSKTLSKSKTQKIRIKINSNPIKEKKKNDK